MRRGGLVPIAALLFAAAAGGGPVMGQGTGSPVADPAQWPKVRSRVRRDAGIEARIDRLLAAMSIEDKVGQLIQVDLDNIRPEDLLTYKLGSVLNGGNSGPGGNDRAPAADWLALADRFYAASMTRSDGRPAIPVIWGTDAVHGNNNVPGATLFPHNIGLGATRNADLVRRIGEVTAIETIAAGQQWTFAPTVAVAQDDRWGRTYESYSEDPEVVRALAGAVVEGLQGRAGTADFLSPRHVVSSTKHFLGDGGTGGRDQGDTRVAERELIDVHFAGYRSAIAAGTQIIMASFSSWNGAKMHGNRSLLTSVLKGRAGFDGFVVGDWNGHGQVPGCAPESCAAAINAGLDMFMYSGNNWKKLYENTLAQARSGEISAARLDDAVRRILRVKLRAGLFERGKPSSRPLAGRFELLGAPEHRALARQAGRESLVLLKNDGVLPLRPNARILVAGAAADSIAQASGGWSISWQGDALTNADFPNGQSIRSGIEQAVAAAGGTATYAPDGSWSARPDAAIVVFGEKPYAEILGDRPTLEYSPGDKSDLALLRRLKQAGIPVVAVFLSGRPLWVNAEINASDAFVAAFLPGTEGGGVADLLFRRPDGGIAHDFRGKLGFSWPRRGDQYVLNRRHAGYDPLFPFGYGLSYKAPGKVPQLDEARPAGPAQPDLPPAETGLVVDGLRFRDLNRSGVLDTYEDWRLGADRRAADLVRRMTLEEKAGTMMHGTLPVAGGREVGVTPTAYDLAKAGELIDGRKITSFITRIAPGPRALAEQNNAIQRLAAAGRLGIPVTISTDPRNHFQYVPGAAVETGGFSQWPDPIGFGALGDPGVVRRFAGIARREYRAVGIHQALSPQADLATEPRWPRATGTFGSNARLVAPLVRAYVEGFQQGSEGLGHDSVLAVVKHWVGYGAQPEGFDAHNHYGRFAKLDDASFAEHVAAFDGAFAARVAGVMPAYPILEGVTLEGRALEPVGPGFSSQLLTGLLRRTLGFDGIILSDWAITSDCREECREPTRPHGFSEIATPWGVEALSERQRFVKGIEAGLDQFGGAEKPELIVAAVRAGELDEAQIDQSARRVLAAKFRQGLFENPYVDAAAAERTVGDPAAQAVADDVQRRAQVLLQNRGSLLPLKPGSKVYVHGLARAAARAAGFEVAATPAEADVAILRMAAPFELLHPNHFFGRVQHEGRLDFRDGDPDYEALKAASARIPTIVAVYLDRPAILANVRDKAAAILANFGASDAALLDVIAGKAKAEGRLPFELPSSMAAVATQDPAMPDDAAKPLYPGGYRLERR